KFVIDRNIAAPGPDGLIVETGSGIRTVVPIMDGGLMVAARVAMGEPEFAPDKIPVDAAAMGDPERVLDYEIEAGGRRLKVTCLSIGNPHAVVFLEEDVDDFLLLEIGPHVENHPLFPNRINFEIANVVDRGTLKARIYERGAGETLSSGTGATAVAVAARLHGFIDDTVRVQVPGGELRITWPGEGEIFLEGPAVEVFEGVWPD
ncbi:MAG: diaminopimelate epimerase, partial [Chloroflexi bacterium]|nr:diaminopimelate epimerase [Chloroflexota bacterium]